MAKVTSKRQVTIPKVIADRYGIATGDELEFRRAGSGDDPGRRAYGSPPGAGSRFQPPPFGTLRRCGSAAAARTLSGASGWSREELYERARPR
ncbi:MAG: AbrB/MazE/SpoVT family DNA-binding domain-containing protein [Solirubrobacterales bacterium]